VTLDRGTYGTEDLFDKISEELVGGFSSAKVLKTGIS
jgi:hypothetical protein